MKAIRVSEFGDASVMKLKGMFFQLNCCIFGPLVKDFQLGTKWLNCKQLLRIRLEIEIPKAASNEVLIKVHAAGINPVDTYIRAGQYIPSRLPALPYTPGGDVCGEVVEVGSDVSEFSIGDKGKVWPLLWHKSDSRLVKTLTSFYRSENI